MIKNVCVVGGGSTAHTLIPLLSSAGMNVDLLTAKPALWNKVVRFNYVNENGQIIDSLDGSLGIVSDKPQDVIPSADVIILCMPVSSYKIALHRIASEIDKDRPVIIGTVYGQGGFNWMVEEIRNQHALHNLEYFSSGLVPWICRIKEYGKVGVTYGPKIENVIAVSNDEVFGRLDTGFLNSISLDFFKVGRFNLAENFISLTFSVDNQIIHTSRLFSLYKESNGGKWKNKDDVPYFYRDFNEFSAEQLLLLDNDYENIRIALRNKYPGKKFTYMMNYLDLEHFSYASESKSVVDSFVNSRTLRAITTPVVLHGDHYSFNKEHRFFKDDIYFGLCIAKWFAQEMCIATPQIDLILQWAQEYLEDDLLADGCLIDFPANNANRFKYGIPTMYGIHEIDALVD